MSDLSDEARRAKAVTLANSSRATNPIVITVKPVDRYGTFDAYLGERLLTTSHQPFLEAARVLLAEGVDPATPLVMRHAGSQTDSLKGTVGAAAKLTVKEAPSMSGPVFQKWKPFAPDLDLQDRRQRGDG